MSTRLDIWRHQLFLFAVSDRERVFWFDAQRRVPAIMADGLIGLHAVALLSSVFRLIHRTRSRRLWWDDFWATVAMLTLCVSVAIWLINPVKHESASCGPWALLVMKLGRRTYFRPPFPISLPIRKLPSDEKHSSLCHNSFFHRLFVVNLDVSHHLIFLMD